MPRPPSFQITKRTSRGAEHGQISGWTRFSFDYANSNHNRTEQAIFFNDAEFRAGGPPTGFVLESAIGLHFRSSAVGLVGPPLVIDATIYYVDELGTVFARDAKTGTITDPQKHWTTTLVDPDFATQTPVSPDLYYTAPVATHTHLWIRSSVNGRVDRHCARYH